MCKCSCARGPMVRDGKTAGQRPPQYQNESNLEHLMVTMQSFESQLHSLQAEHEALVHLLERSGIIPAQGLEQELQPRSNYGGGASFPDDGTLKTTGPLSTVPEAEATHPRRTPVPAVKELLDSMHDVRPRPQANAVSSPRASPHKAVSQKIAQPRAAQVVSSPPPVVSSSAPVAAAVGPDATGQAATSNKREAAVAARSAVRQPPESAPSPLSMSGSMLRQGTQRSPMSDFSSSLKGSPSPLGSTQLRRGIPMDQRDLNTLMLPLLLGYGSAAEQDEALRAIQKLLKTDPDAHAAWAGKDKPIQAAVNADRTDLVRVLLRSRADPNSSDEKGVSMLHLSTYNNNESVCRTLLMARADVNGCDCHGQTSLFFCSSKDVCRLLVDQMADVTILNRMGQSALHMAALGGFGEVYEWLSTRVNTEVFDLRDSSGATARSYAADAGLLRADGAPKRAPDVPRSPQPRSTKTGQKKVKLKKRKTADQLPFRMPGTDSIKPELTRRGPVVASTPSPKQFTGDLSQVIPVTAVAGPVEPWEHVQAYRRDDPNRWRGLGVSQGIENEQLADTTDSAVLESRTIGRSALRDKRNGLNPPDKDFLDPSSAEDELEKVINALALLQAEGAEFADVARTFLMKVAEEKGESADVPLEVVQVASGTTSIEDDASADDVRVASLQVAPSHASPPPKVDSSDVNERPAPAGDRRSSELAVLEAAVEPVQAPASASGRHSRASRIKAFSKAPPPVIRPAGAGSIYALRALSPSPRTPPRCSPPDSPRDSPQADAPPQPDPDTSRGANTAAVQEESSAKKPAADDLQAEIGAAPTQQSDSGGHAIHETSEAMLDRSRVEMNKVDATAPQLHSAESLEAAGIFEEVDTWEGAIDVPAPLNAQDKSVIEDVMSKSEDTRKVDGESHHEAMKIVITTPSGKEVGHPKRNSRKSGTSPPQTDSETPASALSDAGIYDEDDGLFEEGEEEEFEEGEEEELVEDAEDYDVDEEDGFGDDVW